MQPHLHIFSHQTSTASFEWRQSALTEDLRANAELPAECAAVQAHMQGSEMKPLLRSPGLLLGRAATILVAATLAAALAGCGSSKGTGTSADPATVVPASAPLYVAATVRPSGAQEAAALAAGRTLTHQSNPYLRLLALLQTPGSPALSFKRDVAPWLGPRAAVFLSSGRPAGARGDELLSLLQQGLLGSSPANGAYPFGAGGAVGAVVMDTSDAAKAGSFITAQARRAGARAAAYRGVAYESTAGGVAFGLVGGFAVIGSESSLRLVIDTTAGGPALAHASRYAKLLASAPANAIAHAYANPAKLAGGNHETAGLAQLLTGARESNISLVPSASSLAIDADVLSAGSSGAPGGTAGGLLSSNAGGAQALAELPGDSWLAFGLGDVGATLAEDVSGLRALASLFPSGGEGSSPVGLNLKGLIEGLVLPLSKLSSNSAQARRDFTSWMGSGGVFASGGSLLELKAAVVISSTDPARSRAAVAKLAAQLRSSGASVQRVSIPGTDAALGVRLSGLPLVLDIAHGRDSSGHTKFVLGLGEASVAAALNPSSTLSGADSTKAAAAALGEGIQPSLLVDVSTFLSLLEGVGLTEDQALSPILPYLRSVTTVAGGARDLGGGIKRVRAIVRLR